MEPWLESNIVSHAQLILDNYQRWFGEDLIARDRPPEIQAQILFESPFVIFSHSAAADPIYNYGSRLGLELWERSWHELLQLPSRQSVESATAIQNERNELLAASRSYGFKSGFSGIRVTKSGRHVRIEDAKLWDLLDPNDIYRGQAATFSQWTILD